MYEQYLAEPTSVSESWREFFADYKRETDHASPGLRPRRRHRRPAPARHRPTAAARPPTATAPASAPAPTANGSAPAPAPTAAGSRRRPRPRRRPRRPPTTRACPLRGAAARIVANMEASLEVPTATSFRDVPAKLLEVNRRVINGYLGRTRGGKVSFTHLIGYAIVQGDRREPCRS